MPKGGDKKDEKDEKTHTPSLVEKALSFGIAESTLSQLDRDDLARATRTSRFFREEAAVPRILNLITQYKMDDSEAKFINDRRLNNHKEDIKIINIAYETKDVEHEAIIHHEQGDKEKIDTLYKTTESKEVTKERAIRYRVFYEDTETKSTEITNPILIAIDIELQKDPLIAFKPVAFMDPSKRTFQCSALEYAIITKNFIVINMIRNHAQRINQEQVKRVDVMIADIQKRSEEPIKPKLLTIPSDQNIADRILIWQADDKLPAIIPKNTLLMQLIDDKLTTYTMVSEVEVNEETKEEKTIHKVQEDKSISLTAGIANKEIAYQNELRTLLQGKPYSQREFITLGDDPHLVNRLRGLCGYTELPFAEKDPTLIKQGDQIVFWGRLNGKWRIHGLTQEEQAYFQHLFAMPEAKESKMPTSAPKFTEEMQKVMKQYHTEYIDLESYRRNAKAFLDKYPLNQPVQNWDEFEADWAELVGGAEKLFSAWIAQLWCSRTPFALIPDAPIPDIKKLLLTADSTNRQDCMGADFFDSQVSVIYGIEKGDALFATTRSAFSPGLGGLRAQDLAAMTALGGMMTRELTLLQTKQPDVTQAPRPSSGL